MWSFRRYIHKIGTYIPQAVPCTGVVNAGGNMGVYSLTLNVGTDIGYTGIKYNAVGVPDRFKIYWNDVLVADSLFVGDNITNLNPTGSLVNGTFDLSNFEYNGTVFVDTGTTQPITVDNVADVANNNYAAPVPMPSNGNGTLLFYKDLSAPSVIRIEAIGAPIGGTSWNLSGICPTPGIAGTEKFMYGFFNEAGKGNITRSIGVFLGDDNKFYTNRRGDVDFASLSYNPTTRFMNDGTFWYELSAVGDILNSGLL